MFRIILFLLLLLPTKVFAYECNSEIDNISKEYQIKIYCNPSTSLKNIVANVAGNYPNPKELKEFVPFLKSFLNSYPKNFVKNRLQNLFLLSNLSLEGQEVAGLSNGKNVWIKIQKYTGEYSDFYLTALHHEFSSNILKSNYSQRLSWSKFSEKKYDKSDDYLNKNIKDFYFSRETSQTILAEGFVYNYGKTDPENDFNTYAELLFVKTQKLENFANTYSLVKRKLEFLKIIYRNAGYTGKFPDET